MTISNAKIYPLEIKLHQASKLLEIKFSNLTECMLSCEFLRVYSPSAEVKGHGPGQEIPQTHKENVTIVSMFPSHDKQVCQPKELDKSSKQQWKKLNY